MTNTSKLESENSPRTIGGVSIQAVTSFPHDRMWVETIPGEQLAVHVHGNDVNSRFSILESISAPGTATPTHYHREDEIFQILEGIVTFACGGQIFEAGPGSTVVIPAGAHHAWRNATSHPARMFAIFLPAGPEKFLTQLQGLAPEEIVSLAAKYGTYVVDPGFTG
jgi:mannose-6-phosphate isomerase-like protein (cupin superfamily)